MRLRHFFMFVLLLFSFSFGGSIRILIDENLAGYNRESIFQEIVENFGLYKVSVEIHFEDLSKFYDNYVNLGDKFIETYMLENGVDLLSFTYSEGENVVVHTFTDPKKDFVSETCYINMALSYRPVLVKGIVGCLLRNMYSLGRLKAEDREL